MVLVKKHFFTKSWDLVGVWFPPEMNLGGGQNFCTFDTPYHPCFIAFLRKNFRNLYFWYPQFFSKNFPKFPKNLWNFSNFFKIEKITLFWVQISPKALYQSKFSQNFPQKYKNGQFSLNNCYFFKIFGAFGAENLYFWSSKNPNFL